MPDVEIGLRPVVGDEHFAVLERVHRAGIYVEDTGSSFCMITRIPRAEGGCRDWQPSIPSRGRKRHLQ